MAQQVPRRKAPDCWDIYSRLSRAIDGSFEKVEQQTEFGIAQAKLDKVTIGEILQDNNLSAWRRDRKRPDWDRGIERIRAGKSAGLYAYHDDRLIRHPADLESLLTASDECRQNHGYHAVLKLGGMTFDLGNDETRTQLRQRVIYAWQEVANTSRRVKNKIRHDRKSGKLPWMREAFGYVGRTNVPNPEQAQIIREVARRVLDEGHTWTEIADDLNQRGITTVTGHHWTRARLRATMSLKRHGGVIEYEDEAGDVQTVHAPRPEGTPDDEPWPILDELTYDRLHAFLGASKRGRMRTTRTLLSGIAHCAHCDIPLLGATNTGVKSRMPDGSVRMTYRCPQDRGGCSMAVTAVHVDKMVRDFVVIWYAERAPELEKQSHVLDSQLSTARQHLAGLERNYANMVAKFSAMGLSESAIEGAVAEVERAVIRARERVSELLKTEQTVERVAGNAAQRWDDPGTTVAERRRMVETAIKSIKIKRVEKGKFGAFDTSRVEIVGR